MAGKAATALKDRYPGLRVIGASSAFSRDIKDDQVTLEFIKKTMVENDVESIDILFVAYNHRYQEKWIKRNMHKIPARVGLGVGQHLITLVGFNNARQRLSGGAILIGCTDYLLSHGEWEEY